MPQRKAHRRRALSSPSRRGMEAIADTYVGLDVHRKIVVATALDATGRELAQEKFGPEPSELIDFLAQLPGRKHVALEACSMWAPYYDTAASTGAAVTLSNPYKTRLIAEASLKSDKVDSEALARLLRVDSIPTWYAPPREIRYLRTLVQDRVFYRRYWTALANHTYHFLIARGIPYEDGLLRHRRKREVLRKLHLPEVDRGLETLLALEERGKELNQAIHSAWLESEEGQLVATIPGIGELTAMALRRLPLSDRAVPHRASRGLLRRTGPSVVPVRGPPVSRQAEAGQQCLRSVALGRGVLDAPTSRTSRRCGADCAPRHSTPWVGQGNDRGSPQVAANRIRNIERPEGLSPSRSRADGPDARCAAPFGRPRRNEWGERLWSPRPRTVFLRSQARITECGEDLEFIHVHVNRRAASRISQVNRGSAEPT